MTQRTMRLYGIVQGPGETANLVVSLNGNEVFNGAVNTHGHSFTDDDQTGVLVCSFDFPMELHGLLPFSVSVSGGDFTWSVTQTNHWGDASEVVDINLDGLWPKHVPSSKEEIFADLQSLTAEQLLDKYGIEADDNLIIGTFVPSVDNWQDANGTNTVQSDGRQNVEINGIAQSMSIEMREQGMYLGDWHWFVQDGETLTCDLVIAPPVQ